MKSYHNTTRQPADFVREAEMKAKTQEELILEIFKIFNTLTASQAHALFEDKNTPITSIRRGITNLMKGGDLVKTDDTEIGNYGKPEYVYKLNNF